LGSEEPENTLKRFQSNYTNVRPKKNPHHTLINRIQHNKTIVQEGRKGNTEERVKNFRKGRLKVTEGVHSKSRPVRPDYRGE